MRKAAALWPALLLAASAAAAAPAPSAEALKTLASAVSKFEHAEYAEALSRFDKAILLFPGWKTASGYRALCRWTKGDMAGAAEDAALALKLQPNDAISAVARGYAKFVTRDYDGAITDFTYASTEEPDNAEAHFGLGSALSAKGLRREALRPLDNAIRLSPSFAAALLQRGLIKEQLRDPAGAAKDMTLVLGINPDFIQAKWCRAKALRDLKDYRRSLDDLNDVIEAGPENSEAFYLRSNVKYYLTDYPGAVSDLDKVIELNPRKGLAYSNRGQMKALLGDKQAAIEDLRKALELEPAKKEKIQAAIDDLQAASMQRPEPAEGARPAPAVAERDMTPPRPRKRRETPVERPDQDLPSDDAAPAPAPKARRGPADPDSVERVKGPERSSGQDESLFIQ